MRLPHRLPPDGTRGGSTAPGGRQISLSGQRDRPATDKSCPGIRRGRCPLHPQQREHDQMRGIPDVKQPFPARGWTSRE